MDKKKSGFLFLICAVFPLFYAYGMDLIGKEGENGPRLQFTGELTGMYTLGQEEDNQMITPSNLVDPSGIYDNLEEGKNGYYTKMDFSLLYSPFSFVDVFVKFYARYRSGSPYIPLQLIEADKDRFDLSFDSAWGRVNAVKGLGFDIPLDVFIKAGKFDSAPASFQNVSRYGAESVMGKIRTKNTYAVQLEAVYPLSFAESVSLTGATYQKFNEGITPLYDTDGSLGYHGQPGQEDKYDIPVFAAIRFRNIATSFGPVNAEALYAYNAEGIYSGHNFGVDGGWEIKIPGNNNLSIPLGFGIAMLEKNIDPLAGTALGRSNKNALASHENDFNTISFRRSLRFGFGIGARYSFSDDLQAECNAGFSYTQAAHIYRETININSLSLDLRVMYDERYFLGGGIYLGALGETEWKTKAGIPSQYESGYSHIFTAAENMGLEIYGGLNFKIARFVLGYNINKGISMNYGLESIPDGQIKYKQKDTIQQDDLYESGGFFTKLIISW